MAFSRQVALVALVIFAALLLLSSLSPNSLPYAEASFLDNIWPGLFGQREKVFTLEPEGVVKPKREGKRVAIIGAGSAGSSTAYYLRRFLANSTIDKLPLDISIYEKNSYVGGRSITVDAYDDPKEPVELGASIFVEANHNLVGAAKEFGLIMSDSYAASERSAEGEADVLGVFDGRNLVFNYPEGKWWSLAKIIWRYGPLAPWRTKKLTESVVGKFLTMYDAPLFPFSSLSEAVEAAGLLPATGSTGEQFLSANGIKGGFAQEMIQASTRVNYGQNLGLIHGVETMVCMATEGAMNVEGGNWQIFASMVNSSNVDLRLKTPVTSISRSEDGEWTVISKADGAKVAVEESYDSVVLAGPLQFSQLSIKPQLEKTPDEIPYATLHVTLFASPLRLDSTFFGLKAGQPTPWAILTTLNETERSDPSVMGGEGKHGVGAAGFFSVSTLRSIIRPGGGEGSRTEYLYKVFSPEQFTDDKLRAILGIKEVDGHTAAVPWIHRHVWKAYPYEYPRVTFEESKLADGLWYTAGIESFISTMETSSLMGMNVAKLMVDEWTKEKLEAAEHDEPVVVVTNDTVPVEEQAPAKVESTSEAEL